MPATIRSVVVLPQPEGPSRATNSPLRISRSSASTADTLPNCLVRRSSRTRTSALDASAVDLEQLILGHDEQQQDGQDVVQPERRENAVVDKAAFAKYAAHHLA